MITPAIYKAAERAGITDFATASKMAGNQVGSSSSSGKSSGGSSGGGSSATPTPAASDDYTKAAAAVAAVTLAMAGFGVFVVAKKNRA